MDSGLLFFHFLQRGIPIPYSIFGFILLAFFHSHRSVFTILGEIPPADKRMNPRHLGTDLADILIRINPDSNFGLHFALGEFALSFECSCKLYKF